MNYLALFLGSTNSYVSPSSHREERDRSMWDIICYSCFPCLIRNVAPSKAPKAGELKDSVVPEKQCFSWLTCNTSAGFMFVITS